MSITLDSPVYTPDGKLTKEAQPAAIVANVLIEQLRYERLRWMLMPPLGNVYYLARVFSREQFLRR